MTKKKFINEYEMTEAKEKELWEDCVFVFDANVLLNFYRYPEESALEIFDNLLSKLNGRLWIPAHVKFEFYKHKDERRNEPITTYTEFKKNNIDKIGAILSNINDIINIDDLHPKLTCYGLSELEKTYEIFSKNVKLEIGEIQKKIKKSKDNDIVVTNISKYFEIGEEYPFNKMMEIISEGEFRYNNEIPPGYLDDEGKRGFQKFGDLIIWKQILDYSKQRKTSISIITDDNKEDWWDKETDKSGKTPRCELIKEINSYAGVKFWMYSLKDFIDKAKCYLMRG